jgi:CheY-like chemotaxis protein
MPATPYVLYADDDSDDLFLLREMLNSVAPPVVMHGSENGKEAFNFLESLNPGEALPSVIVLDLNMHNWSGTETLEMLKKSEAYKNIPVFIFTNSDHPTHKALALHLGAADFITKPYKKQDMMRVCELFAGYSRGEVFYKV